MVRGETEQANIQLRAVPAVHLRLSNLPPDRTNPPNIGAFQSVFGRLAARMPIQVAQISPGEIEIAGLPPGYLTFAVNRNGETGQGVQTIEANVSAGDTLDASKQLLSANVSGRVILPEGSAEVGEATIVLLRDGNPATVKRLNKDGTFSIAAVPVGTYSLAPAQSNRAGQRSSTRHRTQLTCS